MTTSSRAHDQLQTVTTVDALERALRRLILDAEIGPGEPVHEVEFADRFQVSRHSFRVAARALLRDGMLVRARNRSLCVPTLTPEDVRDIFRLRSVIELAAVRLILERRPDLSAIESVLDELFALDQDAPWRELVELDLRFHLAVVDSAGSARLSRVYETLASEITLCLVQLKSHYNEPAEQVAAEHRTLYETLAAANRRRAVAEFENHFSEATSNLLGRASDT